MKRGGHVAGRRCSRCLCDSVQIHPTLKRRMCTKRKRDESWGAQNFPQQLRIHPLPYTHHDMRGWTVEGEFPPEFCSFTKTKKKRLGENKNLTAPFPSTTAVTAQCALRLSAARKSFCPLWPRGRDTPICCVYPPQKERVPPTKPARC